MKAQPSPRTLRGFSLVITLSLMVLLLLLAVGLLSLSSITLRAAGTEKDMATARANARMALILAIGELQKYAGADQRVTANAEIGSGTGSDKQNLKWTGVWSTTALDDVTKPMVGGNTDLSASGGTAPNAAYFTDRRNLDATLRSDGWKSKLRLAWLVSGSPNPANDPTAGGATPHITLVERAAGLTSTDSDPLSNRVSAPLVKTDKGGYAYWVGDESQKARIDQATPYAQGAKPKQPDKSNPKDGGYYNLMGAAGPNFASVKAGSATPYAALMDLSREERAKILSTDTVMLPVHSEDVRKNFHDVTTESLGVICDVREGGLKKDLTPYLETTGDIVSDSSVLPAKSIGSAPLNPGLAANQPILVGPYFKELGPKFSQMRNWAALRNKVAVTNGEAMLDPQFPPSVTMAATQTMPQDKVVDLATSEQAVHPFMTRYTMHVDFSLDTSRAGGLALRTHVYPRITLWNPYNVKLKGARYLIACRGFHGFNNLVFRGKSPIDISGDPNSGKWCPPDAGFNGYFYYVTDPVDFAPGECLVFVPDVSKSSGPQLGSNAAQYDALDISKNVLSATVPPGKGATNFYFPSGKQVDPNPAMPPGTTISYKSDNWFTGPVGIAAVCVLKKTTALVGAIPPANVFNNAGNSTLQLINLCESGGNTGSYWSYSQGVPQILQTYESNDDRVPPIGWAQEERQVNLIESGHSPQKPASTFAHNNMRPALVHRSPFCNCCQNYWDIVGGNFHGVQFPNVDLRESTYVQGYDDAFKRRGSPFSTNPANYGGILSYPMFDIPHPGYPMMSLANLQHVQFSYQAWQPSFVLGHSLCDIRSDRDATVDASYFNNSARWAPPFGNRDNPGRWYELLQMDQVPARKNEIVQYDSAFMVNQNLWDRFYLSSIPYEASKVAWDPQSGVPLPNSHLVINPYRSGGDDDMAKKIGSSASTSPFDYSAYYLMNQGAFNINSVSVEAWRAFFSTLNRIERPAGAGSANPVLAAFSRMVVPPSDQEPRQIFNDNGAWNGMKSMTEAEIDTLSQKMVEVVKARGPFLGLTDFINRRLGTGAANWNIEDPTVMGPLQAAIDAASKANNCLNYKLASDALANDITNPKGTARINSAYRPNTNQEQVAVNRYYPWKQYGAAGLMNQADILLTLAPSMTARGDTFVIRTYGEARDAGGKVVAKAWCEAVVQRTPDYLQSTVITKPSDATGNNPMEPLTARSTAGNTWSANDAIHPMNKRFGRKFVVNKFRWINPSEV